MKLQLLDTNHIIEINDRLISTINKCSSSFRSDEYDKVYAYANFNYEEKPIPYEGLIIVEPKKIELAKISMDYKYRLNNGCIVKIYDIYDNKGGCVFGSYINNKGLPEISTWDAYGRCIYNKSFDADAFTYSSLPLDLCRIDIDIN